MHEIKGVLQGVMNRTGLDERLEEGRALILWDEVASSLATRTEPIKITHGKMSINVTDSVVLHQLTLYKNKYIDKINRMLGKRVVRDIVFRVGKVNKRGQLAENRDEYIKKLHNVKLNENELTKIDEITSQIKDSELRDSLKELFVSQSQLSKVRDK